MVINHLICVNSSIKVKLMDFQKKKIKPCVIGLGYVGFPVYLRLKKKFDVIGYDVSKMRVRNLTKGIDTNNEYSFKLSKDDIITNSIKKCKDCNFFIICVPTPVNKNNKPNLKMLTDACISISSVLKKGDIVITESTVYPGVTNSIVKKTITKKNKLKINQDFGLGYSPERINPGDKKHSVEKIEKILALSDKKYKSRAFKVYKNITKKINFTSNIEAAEAAKCVENIQRDLNIGLFNEIFLVCKKMNINFNEVIQLASTKWNFIKYSPGLVGGHCLPVDPYYFSYISKVNKINTGVLLAARKTNNNMKYRLINDLLTWIKNNYLNFPEILFTGLTYKKDVADLRNSIAFDIFKFFKKKYKKVQGYDPIIHNNISKKYGIINNRKQIKKFDLIVVMTNHQNILNGINKKNKKIYNYFSSNISN